VLTKKAEPGAAAKPVADLAAGTSTYQGTVTGGGQTMPITLTRVIKEDGATWVINDVAKLPFGEMTDSATLDKGTLVVTKRAVKQGPVEVNVAFKDGKASGTLAMNGQQKPIAVDVGGDLFGDGPGGHDAIARLPLAEGYTTTYRNFDLQQQKPNLKQAKVVASEEIATAAGKNKAWKVEITSAEGEPGQTTLWIAADTRRILKTSATIPQMGGAVLDLELQP
jgi:hypothetical protein